MKPIYYITIKGRYIKENDTPSKHSIEFSKKDTCTDLCVGDMIFHKRKLLKIEKITYEPIEGAYQ